MTLVELESLIENAAWFTRCGQFAGEPGALPLAAVASADAWDWLPTSRDLPDPIHGDALVTEAEAAGLSQARQGAERAAAQWVLVGLRAIPDRLPVLVDGPNDFTPAAKGGAVYAARMAAREVVIGRPGPWCRTVGLFAAGYWPCGLVRDGRKLVVL